MSRAEYQIYEIKDVVTFEYMEGFWKWKKSYTGKCTYNPYYVVAKNKEEAIKKYEGRIGVIEIGKIYTRVALDSFEFARNAKVINSEYEVRIPDFTFDDMKEHLMINDFFKIATYYDMQYRDIIELPDKI